MADSAPPIGDCHVCEALIPALLGTSPSQTIGTIDALTMRSNLPCHTCSIIFWWIYREVEEAVVTAKGRLMEVSPHEAEDSMGAHFDGPEELAAPDVMACVLSIAGKQINGLLLRGDDQEGGMYRRVGALGYKSKDGPWIARYPETVVSIR